MHPVLELTFSPRGLGWPSYVCTLNVRLIAELRRLGACVVFASFQKVIIATNKSDVKAARDYAKFVVSTVTSRDLFNTLQVRDPCWCCCCRRRTRAVWCFCSCGDVVCVMCGIAVSVQQCDVWGTGSLQDRHLCDVPGDV